MKIVFPETTKEKSDIFVTSYSASTHICMHCMETMATTDHIKDLGMLKTNGDL